MARERNPGSSACIPEMVVLQTAAQRDAGDGAIAAMQKRWL
jgi:hypothetical protein